MFVCNNIDHKQHVSKDIHKVGTDRRAELRFFLDNDVDSKMSEIQNEIGDMNQKKLRLNNNLSKTRTSLKNQAAKIIEMVLTRTEQMEENLGNETQDKLDEYEKKLGLLTQQLASTTTIQKKTENAIDSIEDIDIIEKSSEYKVELETISNVIPKTSLDELTIEYKEGKPVQATIDEFLGTVDVGLKINVIGFTFLFRILDLSKYVQDFFKHCKAVCCFEKDSALVGLGSRLKLVQADGRVKKVIEIGENVLDIASDGRGQIFIACKGIVKTLGIDLEHRKLFSLPKPPTTLACTRTGDIVVGYRRTGEIIQYTKGGKQVKTWNTLRPDGSKIKPYKMTFNVNGELVVSDSDLRTSDVTVFDVTGKVRAVIKTGYEWPRGLACTKQGNILVADKSLHRVNMYSKDGDLMKTLIPEKDNGLHRPYGLSLSSDGHLWIGQTSGILSAYKLIEREDGKIVVSICESRVFLNPLGISKA